MVLYLKYDTRFKCDILLEYNNNSMGDTFEAELTKSARSKKTIYIYQQFASTQF